MQQATYRPDPVTFFMTPGKGVTGLPSPLSLLGDSAVTRDASTVYWAQRHRACWAAWPRRGHKLSRTGQPRVAQDVLDIGERHRGILGHPVDGRCRNACSAASAPAAVLARSNMRCAAWQVSGRTGRRSVHHNG